jgi:hypothetical protein
VSRISDVVPFAPGPIASAGRVPLSRSLSGQPVVGDALLGMFSSIVVGVISTRNNALGVAVETIREVRTAGVWQPGEGEKLEIEAEGERSWANGLLHTAADFNVPTDSGILIEGVRYRILSKKDFSRNGFVRYELLEGYAHAA